MGHKIVDMYSQAVVDAYMRMHPELNREQIVHLVEDIIQKNIKDIPCELHNNVTHETINTSVLSTFDWSVVQNPIITGNGTFFKQHEEYLSPEVVMLEALQKERKVEKKTMFTFEKGTPGYINHYNGQINIKVIMNADYGGSGTVFSAFFSPYIPPATTGTAKNITTTLICCLEMLSGNNNQWAKCNNMNELFDMIFIVLNTPTVDREMIHDSYSVEDVVSWLLSKVNNTSITDGLQLKRFVASLSDDERTKLMLAFNIRLVLTRYLSKEVSEFMSYIKAHPLDPETATKESLQESGYGVTTPDAVKPQMERIAKIVVDNCVYPFILNDAEVRAANMERIIVCVTDTDSLMVHFAHFLDEFQARTDNFRRSCLFATALGTRLFVENIIPKFVEYIAIGMQIKDKYYRDKFVFKNEFGFLAMSLFAKKMYAASMFVQEGEPRDIHDIAITGLSFKKRDAAEFLEPVMLEMYDKYVLTKDDVEVGKILDEYFALREKLNREVNITTSYHKKLSLKDFNSYDPNRVLPDQARGALVWNQMMPDEEMLPLDRVIVIPLSFELLDQHQNDHPRTAQVLKLNLIDNENRKHDPVICLPESYHEIPDWLRDVVDKNGAIDKLLSPYKQLLGLFDVHMADTRTGMIPSRMIYL